MKHVRAFWLFLSLAAAFATLVLVIAGKSAITGVLLCAVALYESSWRKRL